MSKVKIPCPRCRGAMRIIGYRNVTKVPQETVSWWQCQNCEYKSGQVKEVHEDERN